MLERRAIKSERSPSSALTACEHVLVPVHAGAELVHLVAELYVRLIRVGFAILLVGCALTLWFATLKHGSPGPTTSLFVVGAAFFGVVGVARPDRVYLLLRSRRLLQVAPAAFGAVAVLLDGPDSECWWIALPLLWIVAAVSSTWLAVGAAAMTAVAFLAGTILGGQALLGPQDSGVLPTAVGLPAYTLVGRVLIDGFAGLVLGRRLIVAERQQAPSPLRVPNLAASAASPAEAPPPAAQRTPRSTSPLTARQLQVTLLLRDGLRQTEIASCLGISVRQVERLLGAARARAGATTTSELVAMLASGALAHANPEITDTDAS
jgi:DNA-binding CsgD family transcriptional regulator